MTKQGEATVKIARYMLGIRPGDRLPTVSEFCELAEAGVGTVQAALRTLEEEGAVSLESHGHQGTFAVKINRARLWEFSLYEVMFASMPLPYTTRLQGLATALYEQFERANIPFSLAYVRGGRWRVRRLLDGRADFIVCSRLTARLAQAEHRELVVVADMGEESYTGKCVLVFRDSAGKGIVDGMRVGVDRASYDQMALTEMSCRNKQVEFVPLTYTEYLSKLREGAVDVIAWSLDEVREKNLHFPVVELVEGEIGQLARDAAAGVIVTRKGNSHLVTLIREVIDCGKLREIQRKVMAGEKIPSY